MYKIFDCENEEIDHKYLQDKSPWCEWGFTKEKKFLQYYGDKLNLSMNPNKRNDKYAPDLINNQNNKLGDLKTENTPFFQSKKRFNINPQYAVVFNKKDRIRYQKKYPDIEIYFWVDWIAIRFCGNNNEEIKVNQMSGVWYVNFKELDSILDNCHLHWYSQRIRDNKGNAKCSYVISLQNDIFQRVI